MSWDRDLTIKQLDQTLSAYKPLLKLQRPRKGWIHTIRRALGMSARQLGDRIGLNQSSVARFEQSEAAGSITLASLEKVAAGLGCKVVYSLVPVDVASLSAMRERQANKKALEIVSYTSRHMALEDQATGSNFQNDIIAEHAAELLRKWPTDFWDD